MARRYACPTCENWGKVAPVIVAEDGSRSLGEPVTCPTCEGRGR